VSRPLKITLIVAGVVLLCALGLCGVGALVAPRFADVAGCRPRPPDVSGVQTDAARVQNAIPALGTVSGAHWRWREARAHTCPDIGPTDLFYEGFAALATARGRELLAAHRWEPTAAPDIPPELAQHAPPGPAWHRSPTFDAEARASIWLDPTTATVFFRYLRG
jgi:hypothetical protein